MFVFSTNKYLFALPLKIPPKFHSTKCFSLTLFRRFSFSLSLMAQQITRLQMIYISSHKSVNTEHHTFFKSVWPIERQIRNWQWNFLFFVFSQFSQRNREAPKTIIDDDSQRKQIAGEEKFDAKEVNNFCAEPDDTRERREREIERIRCWESESATCWILFYFAGITLLKENRSALCPKSRFPSRQGIYYDVNYSKSAEVNKYHFRFKATHLMSGRTCLLLNVC